MKHKLTAALLISVLALAVVVSLGGCGAEGNGAYRDPSVPIVVEKGQEFVIALESNPSTGYRWLLGEELEKEIVALEKVEFEEPQAEKRGHPGEERWTFKAIGTGRTEITLRYARSWVEASQGKLEEKESAGSEVKEESEGEKLLGEGETVTASKEASAPTALEQDNLERIVEKTAVFRVWVKKKGIVDKEPKKYEDPEEAIEVEEGYRFSVVLESDPTAGFQWRLAEPLDEDVIALVSATFEAKGGEASEGAEEVAPGEEVWTFEALKPGETEISLVYGRPWEKGAPEETRTFDVVVKAVEGEESSGH